MDVLDEACVGICETMLDRFNRKVIREWSKVEYNGLGYPVEGFWPRF